MTPLLHVVLLAQSAGITLDGTITVGTLLHLGGTIVVLVGLYYKLDKRIAVIDAEHKSTASKVDDLHEWLQSDLVRRANAANGRSTGASA